MRAIQQNLTIALPWSTTSAKNAYRSWWVEVPPGTGKTRMIAYIIWASHMMNSLLQAHIDTEQSRLGRVSRRRVSTGLYWSTPWITIPNFWRQCWPYCIARCRGITLSYSFKAFANTVSKMSSTSALRHPSSNNRPGHLRRQPYTEQPGEDSSTCKRYIEDPSSPFE